jgi:putative methyltransferase (TIGR04325 family)
MNQALHFSYIESCKLMGLMSDGLGSKVIDAARESLTRLRRTKPVQAVRKAVRWREFNTASGRNAYWGVYSTFAEATAAAPPTKEIGYDHDGPAQMYRPLMDRVEPSEYAVLYWLERALPKGGRVFDFGGHVGLKFYAFRSIGAIPAPISWTVYDVPAVVRSGRELAKNRRENDLTFTETFEDASGADVFLGLGALQYVEASLPDWIQRLAKPPRTVILSAMPLIEGPRYVTLQNIGTAFCPYLIDDAGAVIAGMERLGYTLRHRWKNLEKRCQIADQPERSVLEYTSLHFDRP